MYLQSCKLHRLKIYTTVYHNYHLLADCLVVWIRGFGRLVVGVLGFAGADLSFSSYRGKTMMFLALRTELE